MTLLTSDIAACRLISTSTWSDALDQLQLPGVIHGLTWRAGARSFAGRAVTIRQEVTALGGSSVQDFAVGPVLATASNGDVLVFDIGGADISTFGGLAAAAAQRRGIEGVLVDGGCRDLDELKDCGLGVLSRSVTPTSGKTRLRLTAMNAPVSCGGVTVEPGACIVADETGAVAIAASRFDEIFRLARRLHEQDRLFRQALDAGREFHSVATDLGHL
jgi:regulator of RNase E activity RraA